MIETVSRATQIFRQNLGQRIGYCVDLIGKKSISAAAVGVTPEQLNKWVKGTVKVPVEALRTLSEVAHVDFSWLATGGGVSPRNGPTQIRELAARRDEVKEPGVEGKLILATADPAGPDFIRLPMYPDVHASAGPGVVPISEQANDVVAFGRGFLRDQGAVPERCSIIWARGTSMEPTIPDGSILVVDHSQSTVEHGCIYVFNVSDRLLVKRARWRMDGKLDLVSDNTNEVHPTETFAPDTVEQLRVVGRLVYFCRTP